MDMEAFAPKMTLVPTAAVLVWTQEPVRLGKVTPLLPRWFQGREDSTKDCNTVWVKSGKELDRVGDRLRVITAWLSNSGITTLA